MSSSGWLLTAIYFAGPTAMKDAEAWSYVIGTGDWINHAIFTYEELASALCDLASRGLVTERRGQLVLSRKAQAGFTAIYGKRKRMALMKVWAAADDFIKEQAAKAKPFTPPSKELFDLALAAYYARMRNA
jgi:hypothetical protein